jgi:hypothetical protein
MKKIISALAVVIIVLIAFRANYVTSDPGINQSNVTAEGGNITFLDIDMSGQRSSIWQGFYGSVTGGISLEDASGASFYDWNVVDAVGEIMAVRGIVADWSDINCSNQLQIYEEEYRLNIPNETTDSINNTYTDTNHPEFEIASKIMSGCRSTLTNNNTEIKSVFWNVMLNVNSTMPIYTAILDNDKVGFNGTEYDFQLLVPVNRTTGYAIYNIYVELS